MCLCSDYNNSASSADFGGVGGVGSAGGLMNTDVGFPDYPYTQNQRNNFDNDPRSDTQACHTTSDDCQMNTCDTKPTMHEGNSLRPDKQL